MYTNKVDERWIVLKRAWFVRPNIILFKWNDESIARVISTQFCCCCKDRVLSGLTNQACIINKLWLNIICNNEAVPLNMKIKPCVLMDQSGARSMKHSKSTARRVSIVWFKHGQEPIRLHKLCEVFKNASYNPMLPWSTAVPVTMVVMQVRSYPNRIFAHQSINVDIVCTHI